MNVEETKKAIAVMQAFVDGKPILKNGKQTYDPYWNWEEDPNRYEVEPSPPVLYRVYQYVHADRQFTATGIVYKNTPHASHETFLKVKEQEEKQGIIRWISDWLKLPPVKKDV